MKARAWLVGCVLLCGCMGGPNVETLIDDLRVVGLVLDPPEVGPSDVLEMSVVVADPADRGADVIVWTCLDPFFSGDCLEAEGGVPWATKVILDEGVGAASWAVPPFAEWLFAEGVPRVPVEVRALACEPGLCPLVDDAIEGDLASMEGLSDPTDGLRALPFEGVSYASRYAWLSSQPVGAHNRNPVVTARFEEGGLISKKRGVELLFEVDDEQDVLVYGYAESGGFDRPETPVREGEVTLTWLPPEDGIDGPTPLYVAFEDGEGGSALWTGEVAP